MTLSRRLRPGLLVVFATITALAAIFGLPAPKAQAFLIQYHETITRAALPPAQVSEGAMLQILVGPPPGAGAVGSDAFFFEDFRHLDNAKNPADMCALAQQAWNTFVPIILSGSQQVGADLADGPGARAAFGGLVHVQQDLYAHSDWVETTVAAGQPDQLAPSIFPSCNPGAFPAGLHTGFFELTANHEDLLSGCPPGGPPPGFAECHSTLNKDAPTSQRGSQAAAGTNLTLFDVASQLATRDTANLYGQIRTLVASTNGENAAVLLFQSGGQPSSAPEAAYTDRGK